MGTRNTVAGLDSSKTVRFSQIWHLAKFWDPYLFLQPLKLVTSNSTHLVFGKYHIKNKFLYQNWRDIGNGSIPKNLAPLLVLQLLKLAIVNLVHNLGSMSRMQKTTFKTTFGSDMGLGSTPEITSAAVVAI